MREKIFNFFPLITGLKKGDIVVVVTIIIETVVLIVVGVVAASFIFL